MGQQFYEDDDDQGQGQGQQPQRTNQEWAELRQANKAKRDAEREAEAAKRELAFMRAGLDASKDPRLAYFMKGYEGKADPDAITAAAIAAGFIEPPVTGQPTPEQQADLAATQRMDAAGSGANVPDVGPDAAKAALQEAFTRGGREEMARVMREQGIPVVESY